MKTVKIMTKGNKRNPAKDTGRKADIEKNESIRIYGSYNQDFDKTFKMGDKVVHDAYNFVYLGTITGITEKTVTIKTDFGHTERHDLNKFTRWNHNFDIERINQRNTEVSYMI